MKKILVMLIVAFIIPKPVNANIICNDGTVSSSCGDCHTGCCSRHGGCSNSYSNSSSGGSNYNTNNSHSNNYSNINGQIYNTKEFVVEKSGDNSIKKVIIDDKEIEVSDNMSFKTEKKKITIEIEPTDSKAKVDYENKELSLGENIININVTAENGNKRNYTLTINKFKVKGESTIKKFILGSSEVEFENNKSTITKLKNESSLEYSYELSNENAKLIMYLNEKETTELKSLKENDIIKLVVIDENDNENIYEITITDASIIYSFLVYWIAALIMISPIVVIIIIIIIVKNKKKAITNAGN